MSVQEYPPPDALIPEGDEWTKDTEDTVPNTSGTTYPRYKHTITGAPYGNGEYVAWTNSKFKDNESWPPSGAFDKRDATGTDGKGWHNKEEIYSADTDASTPAYLAVTLPEKIRLRAYSFTARTKCCLDQHPRKWVLHGSNDDGITWSFIHIRRNQDSSGLGRTRSYNVRVTPTYSTYRWTINGIFFSQMAMHIFTLVKLDFLGYTN